MENYPKPDDLILGGTNITLESPIGIMTVDGFVELISIYQPLPNLFSEVFSTATDQQDSVEIKLVQQHSYGTETITVVNVRDLPTYGQGILQITITIKVDEHKQLTCKVTINETAYQQEYGPYKVS